MSNKTVKISEKNYEKLHELKEIHGLKSIDQVINSIMPEGSVSASDFNSEPPAFIIDDITVTWDDLKNSEINMAWGSDETATVVFKDQYGVLIRFMYSDEVFIEYYHFL